MERPRDDVPDEVPEGPEDPFGEGLPPGFSEHDGITISDAAGTAGEPGAAGFAFPGLPPGLGLPDLGDLGNLGNLDLSALVGMLASPGPVNWEVARQVARAVADQDGAGPTDPAAPSEYAELARAAQAHVAAVASRASSLDTRVRVCTATEWADLHLGSLRPVLEALAKSLGGGFAAAAAGEDSPTDPMAAILPMLAPMLLGLQAGSLIGHLATHALGRYDLPLPTADEPSLVFVAAHIDAFGESWSLPRADLRFYLAVHEVVHATVRSVAWVRERLVRLTTDYVDAYDLDLGSIEDRFGAIDPSDPASLEAIAGDPRELLGAIRSPAQDAVQARLRIFTTVLEGYTDVVLESVAQRLLTSYDRIHEAVARHRIERGEAGRFAEALLGLDLDLDDYARGVAFCRGVVERAGTEGLERLWDDESMLPTPNELEAPGLWLARIELSDGRSTEEP
ncbi:MAG: zinc-dependent metalloprotease [Actinomycetes bacterium]